MWRSVWTIGMLVYVVGAGCTAGGTNRAGGGSGTDGVLTATVDASGATLRHGPLTLIIPDGALDGPTAITIAEVEDAPRGAVGPVFDLGPDGLEFRLPATLLIAYGDADLPPGTDPHGLRLSVLDRGRWAPVEGHANDLVEQTVRAPLAHFSIYGVVAEPRSVTGQGTRIEANGVVLEASAPVYGRLFVSPYYVSAYLDAGAAGDVTVTFSGLPTDADTYAYLGSYAEERLVRAADGGRARFTLDLRDPVLVWFQPAAGTTFIGGPLDECGTVGVRDGNVCRLTSDIVGSVQLMAGTLDCDGHAIRQRFADRGTGIGVFVAWITPDAAIRNCTIGGTDAHFAMGVDASRADRLTVADNRIHENLIGVRFSSVVSARVTHNVVAGSDLWSIALWDASAGNEIANNALPSDHGGITMDGPANAPTANTGNVVHGNVVGTISAGFLFQNAQGNEVRENDCNGGAGIHIYPGGWPNRIYWNNFVGSGWLDVLVDEAVPEIPMEISHDGKGNFWGRSCPGPLFQPGVHSNRVNVGDSFAYEARGAWTAGGVPGCGPQAPVILEPQAAEILTKQIVTVAGTAARGVTVTVSVDGSALSTAPAAADGSWELTALGPLAAGVHMLSATATDAAGRVSPRSPEVPILIKSISPTSPLDGERRKMLVTALSDGPDPFLAGGETAVLAVTAEIDAVRGLGGNRAGNHQFDLSVTWEILSQDSSRVLATAGNTGPLIQLDRPGPRTFGGTVEATWDGRDASGAIVQGDTMYPYRATVRVIRRYTGRGVGPRCSRDETPWVTGAGSAACLVDQLTAPLFGSILVLPPMQFMSDFLRPSRERGHVQEVVAFTLDTFPQQLYGVAAIVNYRYPDPEFTQIEAWVIDGDSTSPNYGKSIKNVLVWLSAMGPSNWASGLAASSTGPGLPVGAFLAWRHGGIDDRTGSYEGVGMAYVGPTLEGEIETLWSRRRDDIGLPGGVGSVSDPAIAAASWEIGTVVLATAGEGYGLAFTLDRTVGYPVDGWESCDPDFVPPSESCGADARVHSVGLMWHAPLRRFLVPMVLSGDESPTCLAAGTAVGNPLMPAYFGSSSCYGYPVRIYDTYREPGYTPLRMLLAYTDYFARNPGRRTVLATEKKVYWLGSDLRLHGSRDDPGVVALCDDWSSDEQESIARGFLNWSSSVTVGDLFACRDAATWWRCISARRSISAWGASQHAYPRVAGAFREETGVNSFVARACASSKTPVDADMMLVGQTSPTRRSPIVVTMLPY